MTKGTGSMDTTQPPGPTPSGGKFGFPVGSSVATPFHSPAGRTARARSGVETIAVSLPLATYRTIRRLWPDLPAGEAVQQLVEAADAQRRIFPLSKPHAEALDAPR